jgi:prepilin-type processing-associated H-X9-DG protein
MNAKNKRLKVLITIALCLIVIGIVASLSLPKLNGPRPREVSKHAYCMSKLKQLAAAVNQYRNDYNANPQYLSQLTPLYIVEEEGRSAFFSCPVKDYMTTLLTAEIDEKTDYLYRPPTSEGDTLPILADKLGNHRFEPINMGFADGHVERKEITPETVALMSEAFGDIILTQQQINYLNRSPLQVKLDNTTQFIKDNFGTWLLLFFIFGSMAVYITVGLKIRRYEKEYKHTPTWEKPKALYIILVICRCVAVLVILLILLGLLLPAH